MWWRSEVDPQISKALIVIGVSILVKDAEQVLLARLAEGEAVQCPLTLKSLFALLVFAQRELSLLSGNDGIHRSIFASPG